MTVAGLVVSTIISTLLLGAFKFVFFAFFDPTSLIEVLIFFILLIVATTAIVRRLGIINFAEAFLLSAVWLIFGLVFDLSAISWLIGGGLYAHLTYWLGDIFIIIGLVLFHKKAHSKIDLTKYR